MNRYLEKIAMNRAAKEALKKFSNPDTGYANMAYHLGHKIGKNTPDMVRGAAKDVSRVNIFGAYGPNHLGGDILGQKLGKPLFKRIEQRNPDLVQKFRSQKASVPPKPTFNNPKFPWE